MGFRVVIRAFTLRRDLGWAFLLKRVLESEGATVFIACSRNFSWVVRVWKPHVVVVNTISQISNSRTQSPESKLVHWPGEGGEPWSHSDARLLSQRPGQFEALSAIFAWAEDSVEHYKRAFTDKALEKVILCGNPRLDLIKYDSEIDGDKKKSIGFATRFNSICHFDGRPTLYSLTRSENRASVIAQVDGFVTTIRLIQLVLEKTPYAISIRPHPLEAPEYYDRYVKTLDPKRISIDTKYDFALWAKSQSVLVSPGSSSFAEAYILGRPVINTDLLAGAEDAKRAINEYMSLNTPEEVNRPTNDQDFISRLHELMSEREKDQFASEEFEAHLYKTHCWPRQFSSIKRGAERIVELARTNRDVPRWWPVHSFIKIKDYLDFKRHTRDNPLHPNKNYSSGYHKEDAIYRMIAERIIQDKPAI